MLSIFRKFGYKNFSATIVNSNCASWGGREAVIAEQGKLMRVDVFGKCGQPLPDEGYVHLNFLGQNIKFKNTKDLLPEQR